MFSINRQLCLIQEWFRPAQVGVFFDGHSHFLAEDEKHPHRRPARAFVAFSHTLLFFHRLKVPGNLDQEGLLSAAQLEAKRFLALLKGNQVSTLVSTIFRPKPEEVRLIFQERDFFEEAWQKLPPGLIPCGAVPAGVALLAYFYQKKRILSPGLYYVRTDDAYQGIVIKEDGVRDFLPTSSSAAQAYLESWSGEIFTEPGQGQEIIALGARALPLLPRNFLLCFDKYPLQTRPKPSVSLVTLWLLPLLILLASQGLNHKTHLLEGQNRQIKAQISQLKQSLKQIESFQEKRKTLQQIRDILTQWQGQKVDLIKIITKLSALFPENTWVRRLEFRAPDELRIWAEGQNALEVLKVLDADPLFNEVKFLTPVTKNTRTGQEVFSLVLKIAPGDK